MNHAFAHSHVRTDSRRLLGAVALAMSTSLLGGCGSMANFASSGFGGKPESSVPTRTTVAAAATPTPTMPTAAASSSSDPTMAAPVGAFGPTSVATSAGSRRGSSLLDADSESTQPKDNGLTEGGGNISQVSFATEGGDYAPDVDRTGSFMVFASTQHRPTFDIYRKSVDGRTVTQLTTDPSDDLMPAIAPDGAKIAFASNRNGNWDIYTMPITGGAPTQVTSDADEEVQPTWAPDGRRVAFSRKNGRTGTWEIWIIDANAPGVRTFVCEGFLPRWNPDPENDTLLFQRARQRGGRLYGVWTIAIVNGEGMNPTEIVSSKNAAILQPSWSPDGAKIVFTTVVNPSGDSQWPDQSDIWIVNADGTGRVGLTNSRFRNMQPAWGADGRVYFVSNRGGLENIWAIAVDGARNGTGSAEFAANAGKKAKVPAKEPEPAVVATDPTPELLRADTVANVPD